MGTSAFRVIRFARSLRVIRAVRILPIFRELYMMLHGFMSAMMAILWATVLMLLVLMLCSVVGVEFINPVVKEIMEDDPSIFDDCPRCPHAYESVWNAILTLLQQI